jgi:urease
MHLAPRELDKLVLHQAGALAQKRLARGLRLNHSEACALLAAQLLELIRDGKHNVTGLMSLGRQILGRRHVLPSVPYTLEEVQVEGTFPDGTKLVTVHSPIASDEGNLEMALYGSGLPLPTAESFPPLDRPLGAANIPGAVVVTAGNDGMITLCPGRQRRQLHVTNDGDRCIQVGSHYHFIECNRLLRFDRRLAYGYRLDIPGKRSIYLNRKLLHNN